MHASNHVNVDATERQSQHIEADEGSNIALTEALVVKNGVKVKVFDAKVTSFAVFIVPFFQSQAHKADFLHCKQVLTR